MPGSAKTRVLFVHTATLPPLGADTWIHAQIIRDLDRATHELDAACAFGRRGSPTPTYEVLRAIPELHLIKVDLGPELSHRSLGGRIKALFATLPAIPSLARLAVHVRRRRVAIIHTSDRPRDAVACVLLGRLTRTPSIVHVHVTYNDWMGRLLRWSLHRADALIAISDFVGQSLIANGIPSERVHVVLNAIDPGAWEPGRDRVAARKEFGVADDAPLVLSVSRLFAEKGTADVIRALAVVGPEFPDAKLVVVGLDVTGGQFTAELMTLIDELGLGANVVFAGRRPDVDRLMAAADVYVMPSFEEPFGLVFLEAMAMRLPVVALADGGTLEVVEHGKSGLLSARGDINGLAANLRRLLQNPELRATMGEYGRRQVEQRFTTQRMARDVADVYRSLARTPP